nr:uncharacterized protein LOC127489973 [Oryctolagus cuniculus]
MHKEFLKFNKTNFKMGKRFSSHFNKDTRMGSWCMKRMLLTTSLGKYKFIHIKRIPPDGRQSCCGRRWKRGCGHQGNPQRPGRADQDRGELRSPSAPSSFLQRQGAQDGDGGEAAAARRLCEPSARPPGACTARAAACGARGRSCGAARALPARGPRRPAGPRAGERPSCRWAELQEALSLGTAGPAEPATGWDTVGQGRPTSVAEQALQTPRQSRRVSALARNPAAPRKRVKDRNSCVQNANQGFVRLSVTAFHPASLIWSFSNWGLHEMMLLRGHHSSTPEAFRMQGKVPIRRKGTRTWRGKCFPMFT